MKDEMLKDFGRKTDIDDITSFPSSPNVKCPSSKSNDGVLDPSSLLNPSL